MRSYVKFSLMSKMHNPYICKENGTNDASSNNKMKKKTDSIYIQVNLIKTFASNLAF